MKVMHNVPSFMYVHYYFLQCSIICVTCIITFYNVPSFVSRALSLSTMFHHLCHVHYHFLQCSIIFATCIIPFYNVHHLCHMHYHFLQCSIICVTCFITFYNVPSFVSH